MVGPGAWQLGSSIREVMQEPVMRTILGLCWLKRWLRPDLFPMRKGIKSFFV